MPIDFPATPPPPPRYATVPKRFMSILDFEEMLDRGISNAELTELRHTKVSGIEEFPEYVNYLHVLGAICYKAGRFVRA